MDSTTNGHTGDNENQMIPLHWKNDVPRRGLGDLIQKANHIAITVSDVGESLWFYTDIIGFQQIKRPNFDRHGAWLTMGNIELHLIKGRPMVHPGDDLIVSHIALEVSDIQAVLKYLKENEIHFETNVSVPKANENEGIVTQFFLRDPDGYYIEICNCSILTDFCLEKEKMHLNGYEESCKIKWLEVMTRVTMLERAHQAKNRLKDKENPEDILKRFDETDNSTVEVDEKRLKNLVKRIAVYGDVIQGETEESLREILRKTRNNVPDAISYIKAKHNHSQILQPPTIYRDNEIEYKPPVFQLDS